MSIIEQIKQLRQKTGISVMECRQALEQSGGSEEKALGFLQKKGLKMAAKKAGREAGEGLVESYVHANGKIGVLLKLRCETDFVARNEDFRALAHDLAMHVAAMDAQNVEELMSQPFIKDPQKTVEEYVTEVISRLGENIKVDEFVRLAI